MSGSGNIAMWNNKSLGKVNKGIYISSEARIGLWLGKQS
jgi:hypothetical protein